MVFALDLAQRISEGGQEILVGGQDVAGRRELDNRLRPRQSLDLAGIFCNFQLLGGDVGGDLDNLDRLATAHDRVIGRLDPDFLAALADALILLLVEVAGGEFRPERLIVCRFHKCRFNEHAVMFADNF